jgi:hypothetical protein
MCIAAFGFNPSQRHVMAVHTTEIHEHVSTAVSTQGLRVAWGGVWSGFLVALGAFMLLAVLGMAIGVTAADVGTASDTSARSAGISAGIWGGVSLLIALFIGGLVATRSAMIHDGAAGMIEGVLIWVLSVLTLVYMAGSGLAMLTGGVFGALGSVTQNATGIVRSIDVGALSSGDADQMVARIRDPKTTQLVAGATGMSQDEARSTLSDIASKVEAARGDPARATAEARQGVEQLAARAQQRAEQAAAQAKPYASATLWTTLGTMVLGLLAAIAGAMVGRRQAANRLAALRVAAEVPR